MKYLPLAALLMLAPASASAEVIYDQHIEMTNNTDKELRVAVTFGDKDKGDTKTIKAKTSATFKFKDLSHRQRKICKKNCEPDTWTKTYTLALVRADEQDFGGRRGCTFTMNYKSNKDVTKIKSRSLSSHNKCNPEAVKFSGEDGKTLHIEVTGIGW